MEERASQQQFVAWLRGLTSEQRAQFNLRVTEQVRREYEEFKAAFDQRNCFLCGKPLAWFDFNGPCLHWLLKPTGFKKRHFPMVFRGFDYRRMSSYVRWVASLEGPGKNVNDLIEEDSHPRFIAFTARYRHLVWSISCGESDYSGHAESTSATFPHYHFQMMVNGKPFIDYSDFHIPFSDDDLIQLNLWRENSDFIVPDYGPGIGMQSLVENEEALEVVLAESIPAAPEEATFNMHTILTAPKGKKLSGNDVADAIEEAKRTGRTMASVVRERFKDASVVSLISPGQGVVEAKPRSPRRKRPKRDV